MRFDIVTIFPHILDSYVNESILKRAREKGLINVKFWDLRDFTEDKHRSVDDAPYGGGPGMVLKVEPIWRCLRQIQNSKFPPALLPACADLPARVRTQAGASAGRRNAKRAGKVQNENSKCKIKNNKSKIMLLSPAGEQFNQKKAGELAKLDQLVLICGRYEGVDARVEKLVDEQLSIGPYVLSGGELPAIVVVEAITRLLPGVLGSADSLCVESFGADTDANRGVKNSQKHFIEYPQYTRPEIFAPAPAVKWRVPKVLLSGDHKKIKEWICRPAESAGKSS